MTYTEKIIALGIIVVMSAFMVFVFLVVLPQDVAYNKETTRIFTEHCQSDIDFFNKNGLQCAKYHAEPVNQTGQ